MSKFSQESRRMAEFLGIGPDAVSNLVSEDAETAAKAIVEVLNEYILDLQRTSDSGALEGYVAQYSPINDSRAVRLKKSGVKIPSGSRWSYLVWVEASSTHQSMFTPLNVFDLLDQGRPGLPGKKGSEGAYPLWGGLDSDDAFRVESGKGNFAKRAGRYSVVNRVYPRGTVRKEPRGDPHEVYGSEYKGIRWSKGPLRKQDPLNLYKRARTTAKRRLGRLNKSVGKDVWDVIYIPDRRKWGK